MNLAPVILFTYNRLLHTKQTIEYLKKNSFAQETNLIIYSDGPKNPAENNSVENLREYLKNITGFKTLKLIKREKNFGLAENIINGVSEIMQKYGKAIILEDDILTAPLFLEYMNTALDMYEKDEKVMHISGYSLPVKIDCTTSYFYKQTSCWGWASWQRAWKYLQTDSHKLLNDIQAVKGEKAFNIDGTYPFLKHLKMNISGEIYTWAIKWQASVFLKNGLALHPNISYTQNIGFDGSGKHCNNLNVYYIPKLKENLDLIKIPPQENPGILKKIKKFFKLLKFKHIYYTIRQKLS